MEAVVDELDNGFDPEAKVRRLQDLVKKLERQNQILLSKQDRDPTRVIPKRSDEYDANRTNGQDMDTLKDGIKPVSLDEVELVSVDKLNLEEDDESW